MKKVRIKKPVNINGVPVMVGEHIHLADHVADHMERNGEAEILDVPENRKMK